MFQLNRGSAIAKIVGVNCATLPQFEKCVTMYVYEEMIDGKKLTEIINTTHENVKYLPGHKLPENVVSVRLMSAACVKIIILVCLFGFVCINSVITSINCRKFTADNKIRLTRCQMLANDLNMIYKKRFCKRLIC